RIFGEIVGGKMKLNDAGVMVKNEWEKSEIIRDEIKYMAVDKNKRILIIDDDSGIRKTYQKILSNKKSNSSLMDKGADLFFKSKKETLYVNDDEYDLVLAERGELGVLEVKKSLKEGYPFAAAFIDMQMPGIDGAQTSRQIWEIDPDIRIVLVTAYSAYKSDDIIKTIGRKDIFYLRKPFNSDEIKQFARALTNGWKQEKQRKEIEKKLRDSEKTLKQTNKTLETTIEHANTMAVKAELASIAKSEFLAQMSHEIRTPMNSVLGFLEIVLENQSIKNEIRQQLSTAHNSAMELLTLINNILDTSKLESGNVTLEKKPFKLSTLIDKVFDTMEIKAREKGLSLEFDIHPSISRSFSGDSLRIRQVMINLLGNAIKFTRQGSVILRVIPGEKEEQLHFMIKDTGIGIAADRLNSIFEPFAQADTSTTRKYGGTGLGTTISKQLVELMGGEIWAESEEKKGSIFHFTVNVVPLGDDLLQDDEQVTKTKGTFHKSGRCFQILVAENNDTDVLLLKTRLEPLGHKITVAGNGREAVKEFQSKKFDIVLMDVQMPEMTGLEAAARIRSLKINHGSRVPIIAMTASVMENEIKNIFTAEMDSFAAKPINFDKLLLTMEKLVPACPDTTCQQQSVKVTPGCMNFNINQMESDLPDLPRLEEIDIKEGMDRWQDLDAYIKALSGFAHDYENFIDKLFFLLDSGDIEQACQITHTLKGVAGNLSVTKVADIAETINLMLEQKNVSNAQKQLFLLENALIAAIGSIQQLEKTEDEDIEENLKHFNSTLIKGVIKKALKALSQYDPEAVAPLIKELKKYISPDQLKPIIRYTDDLDFDNAKNEFMKLSEKLQINN
ncbi:MAG: response regulator, partial [Thermodesulfobacteriota bacterium]|nr:response regulator [Thermodesulfobacteriota bacterium]